MAEIVKDTLASFFQDLLTRALSVFVRLNVHECEKDWCLLFCRQLPLEMSKALKIPQGMYKKKITSKKTQAVFLCVERVVNKNTQKTFLKIKKESIVKIIDAYIDTFQHTNYYNLCNLILLNIQKRKGKPSII